MQDNRVKVAVVVLSLIIVGIGFFVAWEFTADDSFITFRYAKHLSEGKGLVYNPMSEIRVEGYTNFLWVILTTIPHLANLDPVFFSKIMGVILFLACALILYKYSLLSTGRQSAGLLATGIFIFFPASYFHSISGMETILYALVILLLFIVGHRVITTSTSITKTQSCSVPILVLLAGLTRPEGLLPGLVILLTLFFRTSGTSRRKFLTHTFLLLILPGVIYFLWRYFYFGWLLPNTFYVKFGQPIDGINWFLTSLSSLVGIVVLISISLVIAFRSNRGPKAVAVYYGAFLIMSVIPYIMFNLMMNYMNRFLFHALPVIILMLSFSFDDLAKTVSRGKKFVRADIALLAIFLLAILPILNANKKELAHLGLYGSRLEVSHVALAKTLKESSIPVHLRTLAVGDAGAIPYYSEWHTFDFIGLNDEFVAHNPREKTNYIAKGKPTLLLLYSRDGQRNDSYQFKFEPWEMLVDYEQVAFIKMRPIYYLSVYLRKGIDPSSRAELAERIRDVETLADELNAHPSNRVELMKHLGRRINLDTLRRAI